MALAKALVAAVRGGGPGRAQGKLAGVAAGQEHAEPDGANGAALEAGERYKKIVADTARLDALLVDLFLDWHGSQLERIVLDVDATAGTVEELARGGVCARDRAEPALEAALGRGAGAGPPGVRAHGAGGAGAVRASVLDVKWISSEKRFARNFRWTWRHGNRTETETTGGALPGVRE